MNPVIPLRVQNLRLNPAEAEVWITALPEHWTPTLELRGRLMGPRCRFATTIEVAYPLRPLPQPSEGATGLSKRVIIPEPSLWEPESPFLYEGPVELWDAGQCQAEQRICHGLRTIRLGSRGLWLNSRQITLRGVVRDQLTEAEGQRLRQAGCNLLLAPIEAGELWQIADWLGFLVLGRMQPTEPALASAAALVGHAACLGWLLPQELSERPQHWEAAASLLRSGTPALLGMELARAPRAPLPPEVTFVVCAEGLLPSLVGLTLPRIVVAPNGISNGQEKQDAAASSGILGWIDRSA